MILFKLNKNKFLKNLFSFSFLLESDADIFDFIKIIFSNRFMCIMKINSIVKNQTKVLDLNCRFKYFYFLCGTLDNDGDDNKQ